MLVEAASSQLFDKNLSPYNQFFFSVSDCDSVTSTWELNLGLLKEESTFYKKLAFLKE